MSCNTNDEEIPQSFDDLRVNVTKGNSASLFFIAQSQGYFEEQRVRLSIQEFQSGQAGLQDLISGEADITTAAEFAFVSQSFDHPDLRIIAAISKFKNKHFICKIDSGIQKPEQFKGKRIGVTRKSGGEFFLGAFLNTYTIDMSEVTIVDLKPKKIAESLILGDIDVALTWEPHIFNIKKLFENNTISWPAQGDQDNYFVLVTKKDWLQANQEKVDRFLKALYQAENYISTNNEVVKKFLLEKFLYEESYVESILPDLTIKLVLPSDLVETMYNEAKWRIENDLTKAQKLPNYLDMIYLEGMRKVNSQSISIQKAD